MKNELPNREKWNVVVPTAHLDTRVHSNTDATNVSEIRGGKKKKIQGIQYSFYTGRHKNLFYTYNV